MPSDIYSAIAEGVVTAEDFNKLIEANIKSVKERVRRVTEPIDHNRNNDSEGHSRLAAPNHTARMAKRPGGGATNDPRKTGRGRAMLRRQKARHGVSEATYWLYSCPKCDGRMVNGDPTSGINFRGSARCLDCSHSCSVVGEDNPMKQRLLRKDVSASELTESDHGEAKSMVLGYADEDDIYGVWWNEKEGKIRVSNGDWAEYDTKALLKDLEDRFGKGKVEMDAEIGAPIGDDWKRIIPESTTLKAELKFRQPDCDPICPHCKQAMYEKYYIPDRESFGQGTNLFRHRGPCYDKGPFVIEFPKVGRFDEAVEFVKSKSGSAITESDIKGVRDKPALKRLAVRLMRESGVNRDWLWDLVGKIDG